MKNYTITLTEAEMNIIETSMRVAMTKMMDEMPNPPHKRTKEEQETLTEHFALWNKLYNEMNK